MKRKVRELKLTTEATDKEWEDFLKMIDDMEAENRVEIEFRHEIHNQKNWGNKMGQRGDKRPQSRTVCYVYHKGTVYIGESRCHPEDNFDRRKGRLLSFQRAIAMWAREDKQLAWEEFKRMCPNQFSK